MNLVSLYNRNLIEHKNSTVNLTMNMAQTELLHFFSIRSYNFYNTGSEEKRIPHLILTFIPFKNFGLLYSKIAAGAGAGARAHQKKFSRSRSRKKNMRLRNTDTQCLST
jgi:hypothetical protein